MLFDDIAKMTKDYTEQKNWEKRLLEEGYSKAGAKSAAKKIVGMNPKILNALTRWMDERVLEDICVEDIYVTDLVEKMGHREIGAFLILDWLSREPEEAKKALAEAKDHLVIDEDVLQKIAQAAIEDDAENAEEKARLDAEEKANSANEEVE